MTDADDKARQRAIIAKLRRDTLKWLSPDYNGEPEDTVPVPPVPPVSKAAKCRGRAKPAPAAICGQPGGRARAASHG
jgi:hypothetical protein